MERQEGPESVRRDEALMALAILSIYDAQFRTGLKTDPESTLWRHGFALSPRETQEVSGYFRAKGDLSDERIVQDLREQIESPAQYRSRRWRF